MQADPFGRPRGARLGRGFRGPAQDASVLEKSPHDARPFAAVSQPDEPNATPFVPADPVVSPREKPMGFWQHIEELRGVLLKSVVAFVICAAIVGVFVTDSMELLRWPLDHVAKDYPDFDTKLGTISLMEVFTMIIQLCVFGGLLLASPFILFFISQFVSPALTDREMKAVKPLCVSALFLFLLGSAFSFFLLMPSTVRIAIELNQAMGLETRWTAGNYFTTLTWLVLGTGAVFEFPLVIILLVWLGVLSTDFLRKYRRHAIVLIFVIAAVVTPTPDPVTQTIFAAPLYLLFEISILVSSRVEKRKRVARGAA
jgi:sec-independent protein translocase protein TatC